MLEKIIRLSRQAVDMIKYHIISRKYRNDEMYKDMWLISERGVEAKDNGYVFFKYLRENHPEINAWYLIDSKYEKDYNRVKDLGNIIEYNSFEHKIAFLLCKYAISSHIGFLEPWSYKLYKLLLDRKDEKKFIFLQHGIIFNDLSMFYNKKCKIDMFITSTNREYEAICGDNYGFDDGVVVQTGIARYDNLGDFKLKNQILLMPTWREEIITPSYKCKGKGDETKFINSDYFKTLNSFINNKRLIGMLEESGINMIFYPHFEIQPYKNNFEISSDKVILADKDEYDVQELLKSSKLLITDFSSVVFDFIYMKKPMIYYQKVPDKKYGKGYFDFEKDGFGDVVLDEEVLVDKIKEYMDNDFTMEDKYLKRAESCFKFFDTNNCERIFTEIMKMEKAGEE